MQTYRVADLMSKPAITIAPTASFVAAQELMDHHKVRRLPVVDHNRLIGIVTIGDLREAQPSMATTLSVYEWRALLDRVMVAEVMTRDPLIIAPDTPVLRAAQAMLAGKISGLPVVEEGIVVGVITESDLFRLLIADLGGTPLAAPLPAMSLSEKLAMPLGASPAEGAQPALVCYHCGTAQLRSDPAELTADAECVKCHYHLIHCNNCQFFDGIACMLERSEHYDTIPGHSCAVFRYRLAQPAHVQSGA